MNNNLTLLTSQKKLEQKYPDVKFDNWSIIEADGKLLADQPLLSKLIGKGKTQVNDYAREGMPKSRMKEANKSFFPLTDVLFWFIDTMESVENGKFLRKASSEEFTPEANDWKRRKEKADAEKTEEQAKVEKLKRKQLEGKLVDKDDIDKAMTETGAIYVANYRDDLKLLPVALANKSPDEISEFLDKHYNSRIEDMSKIANTAIKIDNKKVFDLLEEELEKQE